MSEETVCEEPTPIETIILDSTRLEFLGDQAKFANEAEALKLLNNVAEELISHPDNQVYVIGTTAGSNTDDFSKKLSEARAKAVKERLMSMGVPESQMIVRGLGSDDPYHEYDMDSNGYLIEEIAQRNRKTIIMDVNSVEATLLP